MLLGAHTEREKEKRKKRESEKERERKKERERERAFCCEMDITLPPVGSPTIGKAFAPL